MVKNWRMDCKSVCARSGTPGAVWNLRDGVCVSPLLLLLLLVKILEWHDQPDGEEEERRRRKSLRLLRSLSALNSAAARHWRWWWLAAGVDLYNFWLRVTRQCHRPTTTSSFIHLIRHRRNCQISEQYLFSTGRFSDFLRVSTITRNNLPNSQSLTWRPNLVTF